MHDFTYTAPKSIDEAVRLLQQHGGAGQVLAGGTDLIVKMRARRVRPAVVVDAKHIAELNELRSSDAGLTIGAAVSCRRIYLDKATVAEYPILEDCTTLVGGVHIQGRASVGGNLCNAAPSADTIPALIALGAVAHIRGPEGKRELAVEEFCLGPGKNALQPRELLVSISIPKPVAHSGAFSLRFIPRNEMDIAVVNAAVAVVLDAKHEKFVSARIAVGAVAPTVLYVREAGEALAGKPVSEASIKEAAAVAAAAARPITDMRGTIEQRRHLTGVLTARALRGAIARARGA